MKGIIVYYSYSGNISFVCNELAKKTGVDLLELDTIKKYPKGFSCYLIGGSQVVRKKAPALKEYTFNPKEYNIIVLATPIWASSFAPPILTFIRENDLSGKDMALITSSGGTGGEKTFIRLKEELPESTLISSLDFFMPKKQNTQEQIDKGVKWMEMILKGEK